MSPIARLINTAGLVLVVLFHQPACAVIYEFESSSIGSQLLSGSFTYNSISNRFSNVKLYVDYQDINEKQKIFRYSSDTPPSSYTQPGSYFWGFDSGFVLHNDLSSINTGLTSLDLSWSAHYFDKYTYTVRICGGWGTNCRYSSRTRVIEDYLGAHQKADAPKTPIVTKFNLTDITPKPGDSFNNPLLPNLPNSSDGSFNFSFTPEAGEMIFIDPEIAVGYDYQITSGSNSFTSVLFPVLAGDTDGYELYALGDTSPTGFLGNVMGGVTFNFTDPLTGFTVLDIDTAAMLDPTDPNAFVTGLTFANANTVSISQTPITAVPEPQTYAMFLAGLGLLGFVNRKKKN